MLDTVGPELRIFNKSESQIVLETNAFVTLTPDQSREASSEVLPINYVGLSKALILSHRHHILGVPSISCQVGRPLTHGSHGYTQSNLGLDWCWVKRRQGKQLDDMWHLRDLVVLRLPYIRSFFVDCCNALVHLHWVATLYMQGWLHRKGPRVKMDWMQAVYFRVDNHAISSYYFLWPTVVEVVPIAVTNLKTG
eukprot:Gb_29463 [translate_table: standard]